MIYGEEFVPVNFNKGLWYAPNTLDDVPDGYCHLFVNLMVDETGSVIPRADWVNLGITAVDVAGYTEPTISEPIPQWIQEKYIKAFSLNFNVVDSPCLILTYNSAATTTQFRWLSAVTNASYLQPLDTYANRPVSMAQYNDRIYGANVGNTAIFRYTGWSTALGTITSTSVQAISGVKLLISFRDRMFAATNSRIYFTEVATSGGYPEDWNSGNNFLNLPMTDEAPVIHNMISHADRIFIFTDKGVFQLYATGSSNTWVIELVTSTVTISNEKAVAVIKDNLVYCDGRGVYILDGATSTLISLPITKLFRDFNSFTIFPFEQGLILTCNQYTNSGGNWEIAATYMVYFDGNVWSRFEPNHTSSATVNTSIVLSVVNKKTGYSRLPKTYFIRSHAISGVETYTFHYYDQTSYNGESGKNMYYLMGIPNLTGDNWWIVKRAKKIMMALNTYEVGFSLSFTVDGTQITSGPFASSTKTIANTGADIFYSHAAPDVYHHMHIFFSGTLAYNAGRFQVPPVVLKKMVLAMNTDTKAFPEGETR